MIVFCLLCFFFEKKILFLASLLELLGELFPSTSTSSTTTTTLNEVSEQMTNRLRVALDSLDALTARRKPLVGKLYFRLLESILRSERTRLASIAGYRDTLLALLAHDRFHRSLLVCCVEIVAAAYNVQVVKRFEISAQVVLSNIYMHKGCASTCDNDAWH